MLILYFDSENTPEARFAKKLAMNAQRTEDYKNGSYALAGGVVDPLPDDVPQFVKNYYAYYKTERGYHPRSLNSNNGWNMTSILSFMNMPILQYAAEIRSAVLLVHEEKAHSCYFSEGAYEKLTGDNKELLIIPGASHVDLYDNLEVIPFEKLNSFFSEHLKQEQEDHFMDYITLSNGVKIPQLSYGVYQVTKKECVLEQADMKVSSMYIAHVKQKCDSFAMIIS